jgi:hypothetical protein
MAFIYVLYILVIRKVMKVDEVWQLVIFLLKSFIQKRLLKELKIKLKC